MVVFRRWWWFAGAAIRRHPISVLSLILIVFSLAVGVRYVYQQPLTESFLDLVSQKKYIEGVVGKPTTLNPLFASTDSERDLASLLFRGLTKTTLSGEVLPDLADSWEVSSGGRTYLFHLKVGSKFHNGAPITIEDVVFTYELAKNQDAGSGLYETFKNLEVQAVGDSSVMFRLAEPFSPFLTLTDLGILPKNVLGDVEPRELKFNKFNMAPTGSGKLRFKSAGTDEITLGSGDTDVVFKFYQSSDELKAALKLGEVRAAGFIEKVDFSGFQNFQVLSSPLYRRFSAVFYNERGGLTAEKGIRQGLSYAINKSKIIGDILGGSAETISSPIPPTSWAAVPESRQYNYDVAQAKSSLDRAGWVGGPVRRKEDKSLEIVLSFRDREDLVKIAGAIAEDWAAVGIRAILDPLSPEDFQAKVLDAKDFEAAIITQEIPADPDQYVLWHSLAADTSNITGMKLPKLDKSLEDGRQNSDAAVRKAKYADFQRFLLDESPVSFLYYPKYTYVVSTKVSGINLKPLGVPSDRFQDIENWEVRKTFF